ncbi:MULTISPECIES: alpha/beta fold hydrolase [unclassified Cryobacterium]|uniref:alpha/beta fold hydrolase n=1 Tax=unclassified Cryobacterium TaxID=2649013 RepID=UPI00106C8DB5|nr:MULTISPECIES: alpha/beta hydrolase [unclassified Cryobacterium]TFC51042.1 alpha/beta hydrolase [Cryobacterium sp. TMB3-1-2]TFC74388.1 alpha/beta hydrolase [Cryobacterium sp. TMB3-15]TFC79901.1 alpha/beta hydrolase [Cryobacterium sp. TMB3-10]TFD41802.1 alpha/beta hydrolase [Cryobacterium sp. TMB3-12]
MARDESPGVPFAIPGAPAPTVGRHHVNGCRLYAEVRGAGPPLLIIGAASDDAEMFRPIAERLAGLTGVAGFTVVTWDPRGTRRSTRPGWPCDSYTHADDAAALLQDLGVVPAAIFGASAGGIVAIRLAVRHPDLVRQVLVYEPGFFRSTDSGAALLARTSDAVRKHLRERTDDWAGALAVVARMAGRDPAARLNSPDDSAGRGPLDAPPGLEWYTERGAALAENFIRDDLPRTGETVDPALLRATGSDIRFAFGTDSAPVFREIAETLTRARQRTGADPHLPDAINGAAHLAYLTPDPIARYIRARCLPEEEVD